MKKIIFTLTFMLLLLGPAAAQTIKFVVNEDNPIARLSQNQVQDFFLKRVRQWPDGTPIRFFDRPDGSAERRVFLREFLKRTARQVEHHWIGQKLYSGDSAPTQVSSDSMTASLVSRFPGGIGYVSKNFAGAKGVKVIEVADD